MRDLEKYVSFFNNDKFATEATGCRILEVGDDFAKCSLKIEPRHINGAGNVMGGAIFTLADFTFAVASNPCEPKTVTTTSQITYLGVAKGTELLSEAKLIKDGRTTCLYEITINDDLGNKIAFVTTSGMHLNK